MARSRPSRPARRVRGALRVYDRAGVWWAQVPGAGRRSLGLRVTDCTREDAYRAAAQRYAAGELDPRAAQAGLSVDLADVVRRYVEAQQSRWAPRQRETAVYRLAGLVEALESLGARRLDDVTAHTLARYVEARQAEGVSAATINRVLGQARAMARACAAHTPPICAPCPALASWKNLPEVARQRDPLIPSPAEWTALVRALETDHDGSPVDRSHARGVALLVATAVQTGLRVDELRHLRAVDISDDAVSVRAHGDWRPKDREERTVPVPRAAATLARELVAWRDTARGRRGRPLGLGAHWIADRLASAWTLARLPGDPPGMHDARRTYATELSRTAGVSVRDVQRLLGHADLSTTERYLGRYRSDAARAAVDLGIAAALSGPAASVTPIRRAVR